MAAKTKVHHVDGCRLGGTPQPWRARPSKEWQSVTCQRCLSVRKRRLIAQRGEILASISTLEYVIRRFQKDLTAIAVELGELN